MNRLAAHVTQSHWVETPLQTEPDPAGLLNGASHVLCCAATLSDLLNIREWLFVSGTALAGAQVSLCGPRGLQALFEMEGRPPSCITWPETAKHAASWLARRPLKKWFKHRVVERGVDRILCAESLARWPWLQEASLGFQPRSMAGGRAGVGGFQWVDWSQVGRLSASDAAFEPLPTLQAGPSALAAATHHHRGLPATALKHLLVIDCDALARPLSASLTALRLRFDSVLPSLKAQAQTLQLDLLIVPALKGELSKLDWREAHRTFPSVVHVDCAALLGHLAYADSVTCNTSEVTLLCQHMARPAPVLL